MLISWWHLITVCVVIVLLLELFIHDVHGLAMPLNLSSLRCVNAVSCCVSSSFDDHWGGSSGGISNIWIRSRNRWVDGRLAQDALYGYQLRPVCALRWTRFWLLCEIARVVLRLIVLPILFWVATRLLWLLRVFRVLRISRNSGQDRLVWFQWISFNALRWFDFFVEKCTASFLADGCIYLWTNTNHHFLIYLLLLRLSLLRALRPCAGRLYLILKLIIALRQSLGRTLSRQYPREYGLIILSIVLKCLVDLLFITLNSLIILTIAHCLNNIDGM